MAVPASLSVQLDDATVRHLAEQLAPLVAEHLRRAGDEDRWLDSREAAAYIGRSLSALHKLTAARQIPFEQAKPGGKCYFRKSALHAWMGK